MTGAVRKVLALAPVSDEDLALVEKFSGIYYAELRSQHFFGVSRDEIRSELFIAVSRARQFWNSDDKASFSTYAISCFDNAINAIKDSIVKDSQGFNKYADEMEALNDGQNGVEPNFDEHFQTRDILRKFSGMKLLIVKELIDPSDKVVACIKAYNAKYDNYIARKGKDNSSAKKRFRARNIHFMAISSTYGINPRTFRYYLDCIKKEMNVLALY